MEQSSINSDIVSCPHHPMHLYQKETILKQHIDGIEYWQCTQTTEWFLSHDFKMIDSITYQKMDLFKQIEEMHTVLEKRHFLEEENERLNLENRTLKITIEFLKFIEQQSIKN